MNATLALNGGVLEFFKRNAALEERVDVLSERENAEMRVADALKRKDNRTWRKFIQEAVRSESEDAARVILDKYDELKEAGLSFEAEELAFIGQFAHDAYYGYFGVPKRCAFAPDYVPALLSLGMVKEAKRYVNRDIKDLFDTGVIAQAEISAYEGDDKRLGELAAHLFNPNVYYVGSYKGDLEQLVDTVLSKVKNPDAVDFDKFLKQAEKNSGIELVRLEIDGGSATFTPDYDAFFVAAQRLDRYDALFSFLKKKLGGKELDADEAVDIVHSMARVAEADAVNIEAFKDAIYNTPINYLYRAKDEKVANAIGTLVRLDRDRTVKWIDSVVEQLIKTRPKFSKFELEDITRFYNAAGVTEQEAAGRIGQRCLEAGLFDEALEVFQAGKNNEGLYKAGLELARKGDITNALNLFEKADLSSVETEDETFYEVIANSILSLYLINSDLNPKSVKDMFNSTIKDVVKDVRVNRAPLEITVDFGFTAYTYKKDRLEVECRNEVDIFTQSKITRSETALKVYDDAERQKEEAFWLEFLDGVVPVKRLLSSGKFNGKYFNQLEKSNGVPMTEALIRATPEEREQLMRRAIDVLFTIYDAANKDVDAVVREANQRGVSFVMAFDYIDNRFDSLATYLRKIDTSIARSALHFLNHQREEVRSILSQNMKNIVHWDYSPRNLMVEDGVIVPIDHEDYKMGNIAVPVAALIRNPENNIDSATDERLVGYARERAGERKMIITEPVLHAAQFLYNVRRARTLAESAANGNAKSMEGLNWHLNELITI